MNKNERKQTKKTRNDESKCGQCVRVFCVLERARISVSVSEGQCVRLCSVRASVGQCVRVFSMSVSGG